MYLIVIRYENRDIFFKKQTLEKRRRKRPPEKEVYRRSNDILTTFFTEIEISTTMKQTVFAFFGEKTCWPVEMLKTPYT